MTKRITFYNNEPHTLNYDENELPIHGSIYYSPTNAIEFFEHGKKNKLITFRRNKKYELFFDENQRPFSGSIFESGNGIVYENGKQVKWIKNIYTTLDIHYDDKGNIKFYDNNDQKYSLYIENFKIQLEYDENGNTLYSKSKYLDAQDRNLMLKEGNITVWKLCKNKDKYVYVKLLVPADAKRIHFIPGTDKTRVEFAIVKSITDENGRCYKDAVSCVHTGNKLTYTVGQCVRADSFDINPLENCSNGIHVHKYKDLCDSWKE